MEPLHERPLLDQWHALDERRLELEDRMFELHGLADLERGRRFDADLKMKKFEKLDEKRFEMDAKRLELDARRFAMFPSAPGFRSREPFATSPRQAWLQGDPADSLYKSARELLNGGEWRRAATAFSALPQRFPNSGYAPEAMYWHAFALYRIGATEDLNAALRSLETLRTRYPQARTQSDAAALTARIRGTLAARGDRTAEAALKATMAEQGQQCDRAVSPRAHRIAVMGSRRTHRRGR